MNNSLNGFREGCSTSDVFRQSWMFWTSRGMSVRYTVLRFVQGDQLRKTFNFIKRTLDLLVEVLHCLYYRHIFHIGIRLYLSQK